MTPQLHILSGNDIDEISKIFPYLTPYDQAYLIKLHPELMGAIPLLPALVPAATWGIKAIYEGITGGNKAKEAKAQAAQQQAVYNAQIQLEQIKQARSSNTAKYLLIGGIGIAGLITAGMLLKKPKRR